MSGPVFHTSPATRANNTGGPFECDASGNLLVSTGGSSGTPPAAAADTATNPTGQQTLAYMQGYNGTTWDRIRAGVLTVSSTLTGFLNALPWAIFHTTPATRTNNQGGPLEADAAGNLRIAEQFVTGWTSFHITTATTTVVKSGAGVLHELTFGKHVATGVVTVYDNTAASGTVLMVITVGAALLSDPPLSITIDRAFATGLTIVTSQAEDLSGGYL